MIPKLPTRDEFSQCLGNSFRILQDADEQIELDLIDVRGLRGTAGVDGRPFSLLFRGPPAFIIPQNTYVMTHERLGALTIFIVPVGRTADGVHYEAVFN